MEKIGILDKIKSDKRILIGIGLAVVIVIVAVFSMNTKSYDDLSALEIIELMLKEKGIEVRVLDTENYTTKAEDINEILGEDNQYISKVMISDMDVPESEDTEYTGGTIEVFKNKEDAKARIESLEYFYDKVDELLPKDVYGDVLTILAPNFEKEYIYQKDNAILRVSKFLDEEIASIYKDAFMTVLKDKTYEQVDVSSEKEVNAFISDNKAQFDKNCADIKDVVDEAIDEVMITIDDEISSVSESLDEDALQDLKDTVEIFNIPYCKDKYQGWLDGIAGIDTKVAEKKAAEEAERLRQEELKANTHRAGMYKVGTDIATGEYVMVGSGYFEINSDSTGATGTIIANDNFDNNSIVTVRDGQYLTVKRATFYPISLNPTISTLGAGMFKVGVHIAAGEYKLVSTSSYSAYCEVTSSSSHTSNIISNDIFDGEKYITVREGQYLKLSRCKIVQ